MSRSTKKPIYTQLQGGSNTFTKRKASRAVRAIKIEETPKDGKSYKKEFNSWDVCDWKFYSPKDPKAKRK